MLTSVHTQPSSVNRAAAFSAMRRVPVILAAILVSQAALGVTLQNGPFQDEATFLYAGRQYADHLAGGPPVTEPYATYFAGLPYLQPLALGALSQLGGVEGARALSTCLMLAVTLGVFFLTALLFDQRAGLFAAALFGLQAPVLFLGRLASYDSGCVALLTFAAVLAVASARVAGWRGMALAGCVAAEPGALKNGLSKPARLNRRLEGEGDVALVLEGPPVQGGEPDRHPPLASFGDFRRWNDDMIA